MSKPNTRRTFLPRPMESLLVCRVATDVPLRFVEFANATRLIDDAIYSSALLSVPIPRYYDVPQGQRRWHGVNPAMMWHPLFWLPPRVADRYEIHASGASDLECDDTWALRVALEITAAGLYDPRSGTWLDVLSLAGIDLATHAGWTRVRTWLGGAADQTLDSIDLSTWFDLGEERDWAIGSAIKLLPMARAASASSIAASLGDMVETDSSYQGISRGLVCRLASSLLPDDAGELPNLTDNRQHSIRKLAKIELAFKPKMDELRGLGDDGDGGRLALNPRLGTGSSKTPPFAQGSSADSAQSQKPSKPAADSMRAGQEGSPAALCADLSHGQADTHQLDAAPPNASPARRSHTRTSPLFRAADDRLPPTSIDGIIHQLDRRRRKDPDAEGDES